MPELLPLRSSRSHLTVHPTPIEVMLITLPLPEVGRGGVQEGARQLQHHGVVVDEEAVGGCAQRVDLRGRACERRWR